MNLSVEMNVDQLICHPSEERKLKDALARNGLGKYVGLVTPCEFVEPGRMLAIENKKLMLDFLFRRESDD